MLWPTQSAGVPPTVSVNVSQLTPSTHVASPFEVPPTAVPSHITGGDAGEIVPAPGLAARERKNETKIRPPIRAMTGKDQNQRALRPRSFSNILRLLHAFEKKPGRIPRRRDSSGD